MVPKKTQIPFCFHADPIWVQSDPTQLEQIVFNLVSNASDAMPEGGKITINTQTLTGEQAKCMRLAPCQDGYAVVSITDIGQGLDPVQADKDV
ncbi:sensory histidine kinase AtoS [Planctomycetes bacterium CA13]|uniref:Sensory histidine kinase AtoS n=1 Tax=Novipirellula herctigrandis TaxID=2527986 RepID=A0A5C5Z5G1_9BACT|nr:sensory histidine kinase AtoS [Planctomycetes bacterium CA13]